MSSGSACFGGNSSEELEAITLDTDGVLRGVLNGVGDGSGRVGDYGW